MYRIVLIDVICGQNFYLNDPRTVYETSDIMDAYQKYAEYTKEYPWQEVVLEQAVSRIVWKRIK